MTFPFWFRLIRSWKEDEGMTGLTLPFIVGADARNRNSPALPEDAVRILEEIRTHQIQEYLIIIMPCGNIEATVIEAKHKDGDARSLFIYAQRGRENEEVLKDLAKRTQELVAEGKFSRVDEEWTDFTDEEIVFINKVIKAK